MKSKYQTIVVDVTQSHIDTAVPRNSGHCIVADAIQTAIPEARRVEADLQTVRFSIPGAGKRYVYLTPPLPQAILVNFDQGIAPEPCSFKLGKPVQIVPIDRCRPADPNPSPGSPLPKDHPRARRAVVESDKPGDVVIENGEPLPTAALSSHPRPRKGVDGRMKPGQRRVFGLRSLKA